MTFEQIQSELLHSYKTVFYKSLTSDKTHSVYVTIPKKFQSRSDKVIMWEVNKERWIDIEVSTIQLIT